MYYVSLIMKLYNKGPR